MMHNFANRMYIFFFNFINLFIKPDVRLTICLTAKNHPKYSTSYLKF